MAYTDIDKPSDYFDTVLYTGNATDDTSISVGFQPDFTWIKNRVRAGYNNRLQNSVVGSTKSLQSNRTVAEQTNADAVKSFNSDGFVLGTDAGNGSFNKSGDAFVSWNWKAGTSFTNDASATGIGSIDSAGSVSTDAGFSVISYTGTGSNGTIAHGLGSAPQVVLLKERNGTSNWLMSHQPLSASLGDYTRFMTLNSTGAVSGAGNIVFQGSAFTSSVFNVGASSASNGSSQTFIAYCFAEKKGYSKFSSYVGNGSNDGSFCFTGMKPSFVMIKRTSGTAASWNIRDNKRNTFNPSDQVLYPHLSNAEATQTPLSIDILSNGFKLRGNDSDVNASGANYIYMAFAENPFVTGSSGIPATAR